MSRFHGRGGAARSPNPLLVWGALALLLALTLVGGDSRLVVPARAPTLTDVRSSSTTSAACSPFPCVIGTVPLGPGLPPEPTFEVYDSGRGEIFVADALTLNTTIISDSTDQVVATLNNLSGPMAYDGALGEVFIANSNTTNVSVVSDTTDEILANVTLPSFADDLVYDGGTQQIFATWFTTASAPGTVSVISTATNRVVANISVGFVPDGLAYDPAKGEIFVANADQDCTGAICKSFNVSVISDSTDTVVAAVDVGVGPHSLAYDSAKGEVFVANSDSNTLCVISDATNSVVDWVKVGRWPASLAYDAATGEVFVANSGSYASPFLGDNVSVVWDSTDQVIATVGVGSSPTGIVYDSARGEMFVSNWGTGTESVISDGSSSPTPLTVPSFGANPSSLKLGAWTNLTVSTVGGEGTLSYAFAGLPPGCPSLDLPVLPCDPTGAGSYTVRAYVNDSLGHTASATLTLTVAARPAGVGSTASLFGVPILEAEGLLVGAAVVAVAVVVLVGWTRSRRREGDGGRSASAAPAAEAAPAEPATAAPSSKEN